MSFNLLAIETATNNCSVALYCHHTIIHRHTLAPQKHSQLILPLLEAILAEGELSRSQLDAIAFGCGPGSFTGIRLATSVAQTIAFVQNIPVIPISSLRGLAQQAWRKYQKASVIAALDARLKQVYWGHYQLNQYAIMDPCYSETVCDPQKVQLPETAYPQAWIGIGSGWDVYSTILKGSWLAKCYPEAYDIALIAHYNYLQGKVMNPLDIKPVYLRNQVAHSSTVAS